MDDTKGKIIEAATGLFAERGLAGVTVREICSAAGVNGALVNYHFRSKEGLYAECVARLFQNSHGSQIASLWKEVKDAASWRKALTDWIHGFSEAMHQTAPAAGFFRQEVIHPSAMHETILREYGLPIRDCLLRLLKMAGLNDHAAMAWALSIWAELSAYALVNPAWHPYFRPADVRAADWPAEYADALCRRTFALLKFGATP